MCMSWWCVCNSHIFSNTIVTFYWSDCHRLWGENSLCIEAADGERETEGDRATEVWQIPVTACLKATSWALPSVSGEAHTSNGAVTDTKQQSPETGLPWLWQLSSPHFQRFRYNYAFCVNDVIRRSVRGSRDLSLNPPSPYHFVLTGGALRASTTVTDIV